MGDDVTTTRPDGMLIAAWGSAHAHMLGTGLRIEEPSAEILRIVNREGEDEDRVVVRVRFVIHRDRLRREWFGDVRPLVEPTKIELDERWTFGRHGAHWFLQAIDGDPLAGPVLEAPLIPNATFDDARLRAQSLRELARADAPAAEVHALVASTASPSLALLDLSLVDGRFLPALLAAAITRLVEAWDEASTGSEAPLRALASAGAADALLHPGLENGSSRLILQDTELARWTVGRVDLEASPPRVAVVVAVAANAVVTREETRERLAGRPETRRELTATWTLELSDQGETEWWLESSTDPSTTLQRLR